MPEKTRAFHASELEVSGEYSTVIPRLPPLTFPKLATPVSPRENALMFLRGEQPLWMPCSCEMHMFQPSIVPDNVARGAVIEAEPYQGAFGGRDMFGVLWEYVPGVGGSMVRPGAPLVPDTQMLEELVVFPDLDAWDWEGSAQKNRAYLNDGRLRRAIVQNGLFERLVSLTDMESALVSFAYEEEAAAVGRFFDRLCRFYDDYFARLRRWFDIDLVQFHDDWGSQRAPLFSPETCRRRVAPWLKRIVDSAHEKGMFFELHSCGKNDILAPVMVECGVDLWCGQPMVDKRALLAEFGGRMRIGALPEGLRPGLDDRELEAVVRRFVGDYPRACCGTTPVDCARLYAAIYECSRRQFWGAAE